MTIYLGLSIVVLAISISILIVQLNTIRNTALHYWCVTVSKALAFNWILTPTLSLIKAFQHNPRDPALIGILCFLLVLYSWAAYMIYTDDDDNWFSRTRSSLRNRWANRRRIWGLSPSPA